MIVDWAMHKLCSDYIVRMGQDVSRLMEKWCVSGWVKDTAPTCMNMDAN
jgi:hypothetical protein